MQAMGGLSVVTGMMGIMGHVKRILLREKRKDAEVVSGIYETAAFADLDHCEDAGLLFQDGLALHSTYGIHTRTLQNTVLIERPARVANAVGPRPRSICFAGQSSLSVPSI
jgi:hypothetical protein